MNYEKVTITALFKSFLRRRIEVAFAYDSQYILEKGNFKENINRVALGVTFAPNVINNGSIHYHRYSRFEMLKRILTNTEVILLIPLQCLPVHNGRPIRKQSLFYPAAGASSSQWTAGSDAIALSYLRSFPWLPSLLSTKASSCFPFLQERPFDGPTVRRSDRPPTRTEYS